MSHYLGGDPVNIEEGPHIERSRRRARSRRSSWGCPCVLRRAQTTGVVCSVEQRSRRSARAFGLEANRAGRVPVAPCGARTGCTGGGASHLRGGGQRLGAERCPRSLTLRFPGPRFPSSRSSARPLAGWRTSALQHDFEHVIETCEWLAGHDDEDGPNDAKTGLLRRRV